MKLYYSRGACSLAVRIILHEIGITCEYEAVDLKNKKTASGADYFNINSKGAVPALVLKTQEILTENAAIQQYLADEHKAFHLLPPVGNFNRYRVIEWLNYVSTDLHKSCGPLFNPNVPDSLKDELFKPLLKTKLNFLNYHLSQNKFLAGNEFTLPDGYAFAVLRWLKHFGIQLTDYANLSRYFEDLKKRKSVIESMNEEGLSA